MVQKSITEEHNPIDSSGIFSLSGFTFQIRVFILKLLEAPAESEVGFELIDDVSIKQPYDLDRHLESIAHTINSEGKVTAVQVKRTKVTKKTAERVFFNWLIAYSKSGATHFELICDQPVCQKNFESISSESILNKINKKNNNNSLLGKIREIYKDNKNKILEDIAYIKEHYIAYDLSDIDGNIFSKLKIPLHEGGVSNYVYYLRIERFINSIQGDIMNAIHCRRPFVFSSNKCSILYEEICQNISDDKYIPSFSKFKENNCVPDFSDIKTTREYKQLSYCSLTSDRIKDYFFNKMYYEDIKYRYIADDRRTYLADIEENAYSNFILACDEIRAYNENDSPAVRLVKTQKKLIKNLTDVQSNQGAYIHLTKEDTSPNLKISWKDEDE